MAPEELPSIISCRGWIGGGTRYIDRVRRGREERREKKEEGNSEPLVHPVTKDREGAGIPEITKVGKRS